MWSLQPAGALEATTLRVGLIGCGSIGSSVHLPLLARMPGVTVAVVADPSPAARARAQAVAAVVTADCAQDVLDRRDVDAVIVCAPSAGHAELATAAAEAGKHLYLEKPLATTEEDGKRVLEGVERAGITAAIGFNYRFNPGLRRMRELLRAGLVGRVRTAATRVWEPAPAWRTPEWKRRRATGGGVLLDLASHHIDLLRWLLDDEIETVEARMRSRVTEDDVAIVRFGTTDGVICDSSFSYRSGRADVIELAGEQGRLRLDRYTAKLQLLPPASPSQKGGRTLADAAAARLRAFRPTLDPSYELALRAFCEHLRGRRHELPSILDGLRSLEAVRAAERSARSPAPPEPQPIRG